MGKLLGSQPTTLYKINPAACHAIAERYTAHRRELREKRLQGYASEIRQMALSLQAERMSLTQRHTGRYLAQPAILRDPNVRELPVPVEPTGSLGGKRSHGETLTLLVSA